MQVHLDLVGGLAGDMFIAALLDAFPQHESGVLRAIDSVSLDYRVKCTLLAHSDSVLQGRRFAVEPALAAWAHATVVGESRAQPRAPFAAASHHPGHVTWRSIRARLGGPWSDETRAQGAAPAAGVHLSPAARRHALGIFQLLADAEAFVHGVDPENVEFHEVGAWDSIADIVGAAVLIDAIGATRWSASPAPLGSGRVETAHGVLPVPAPATTRLLMGMSTLDDGIGGERVTPTGAAILRYLCPPGSGQGSTAMSPRTLVASGTGFGRRTLPGLSNHLRVLCFEQSESPAARLLEVLEFEVDDQSGEDLAAGLDRLRAHPGVLDVTQAPVFGKKGRMMMHVCVLARHTHLDQVLDTCFRETTTIGLRHRTVHGVGLRRRTEEVEVDGTRLRVKVVDRPGGATAKAESDDVLGHEEHARRASLRRRAERAALCAERLDVDA